MKRKVITVVIAIILVSLTALPAVSLDEAQDLLIKIDEMANFGGTDFSAMMSMISEDPESGIEKTVVQQFRSDDDDKFLMLINEPIIQKGQGYLMVDNNLWFYDPESRKFSHTSMNDQFNGSDANNSDFNASSVVDDYRVKSIEEGKLGKYAVYILELEAKNNEVTYQTQKIWVTINGTLTLKTEDYSAGGRLMRTSYYPSYANASGNFIPTKTIFVDGLIEGKKTTITISDISTEDIPDMVFTKSYIERVN